MKQRSNPGLLSPEETTFRLHRAIRAPNQSFTVLLFSGKAPWDLEMGGSGVRPNAATAAASSSPPEFQLPDLKGMTRGHRVSPCLFWSEVQEEYPGAASLSLFCL